MKMATRCLLLVLALSALCSSSAVVFESIDCGSDRSFVDSNGIKWKGDRDLIQNGDAPVVAKINSMSTVMDTLRVFKTRNKNCYNIKVKKGEKILVRASFYYGNYDGLSSPPSFDLLHDGNYWSSVSTSSIEMSSYEIIYVPKGDVISVCVAQTAPNQFPFISALELRSLGPNMYIHMDPDFSLRTRLRVAYGTNSIVRFPEDKYDRIWNSGITGNGSRKVVSDATIVDTSTFPDEPPPAVLLSAITSSDTIQIPTDFLTTETSIYLNMYFSEVTKLTMSQKRSFAVFKDNKLFLDSIVPLYGGVVQMYANNTIASSDTVFSLVPTLGSTLPPIVNASEFFRIGSTQLTDGTNSNDVDGLAALQSNTSDFEILQEWRSDPCLPAPYSWEWITCTSDTDLPRVTALNLNSFGLKGTLPDFSSMTFLETIDLSNNSLSGNIPAFLGTLPYLKELNLAYNNFSGEIPTSLGKTKLNLILTGNVEFCTPGKSCETKHSETKGSENKGSGTTPTLFGSSSSNKMSNNILPILGGLIGFLVTIWN